jgi:hypothetical protein
MESKDDNKFAVAAFTSKGKQKGKHFATFPTLPQAQEYAIAAIQANQEMKVDDEKLTIKAFEL